jgi:hypothetical protein
MRNDHTEPRAEKAAPSTESKEPMAIIREPGAESQEVADEELNPRPSKIARSDPNWCPVHFFFGLTEDEGRHIARRLTETL